MKIDMFAGLWLWRTTLSMLGGGSMNWTRMCTWWGLVRRWQEWPGRWRISSTTTSLTASSVYRTDSARLSGNLANGETLKTSQVFFLNINNWCPTPHVVNELEIMMYMFKWILTAFHVFCFYKLLLCFCWHHSVIISVANVSIFFLSYETLYTSLLKKTAQTVSFSSHVYLTILVAVLQEIS